MTILITGGAGFIGSLLAARLLEQNKAVVILDNFNDYYDPAIKRANVAALGDAPCVIEGDVRDEALVQRIFKDHKISHVAHLAAMAGVRYSIDKARLYTDVNVGGSVTLMDTSYRHNVEVFIQASTSSVYGNSSEIPFKEKEAANDPLAPYPASKRAAELFAHSYHQLFGLNVTVLRFFNVYGPQGRPDMMPIRVIDSILKGESISIYGDGTLQRDWTYIDDTVDGIIGALENPLGYAVLNLGYGSPVSLNEFILIYERLIGKPAVTHSVPMPLSEPLITYCDNTQARQMIGFTPKVELEEGLARTWAWYKQVHGLS